MRVREARVRRSRGVPSDPIEYLALAVVLQLTAGGNVWGAETLLMGSDLIVARPALHLLQAGRDAEVVTMMRELLAA